MSARFYVYNIRRMADAVHALAKQLPLGSIRDQLTEISIKLHNIASEASKE